MKNTLRQVFHSPKFVVGFVIFLCVLLTMFIYPLINPGDPLEMIGVGGDLFAGLRRRSLRSGDPRGVLSPSSW